MKTLAERLAHAMKLRGLTQEALAEKARTSQTTIFKILSGKTKESKKTPALAIALDCPADWLGSGLGEWPASDSPKQHYRNIFHPPFINDPSRMSSILLIQEYLNDEGLERDHLGAHQMSDDSMAPKINAGNLLLINKAKRELESAAVLLISQGDRLITKRAFHQLDGSWSLKCDNPDKSRWPDESLTNQQIKTLNIIGTVVAIFSKT